MAEKPVTINLAVGGMTCVSCENRIESKLKQMTGIAKVTASYSRSQVTITYDPNLVGLSDIKSALNNMDYPVSADTGNQKSQYRAAPPINQILGVGMIILAVFMLINYFGGFAIFNQFPQASQGMGYGALFLIGLLTSVHCVAMCGGINLSQCVPRTEAQNKRKTVHLRPGLLYNGGRVIAYTVVGGIVGGLGAVISFSGAAKGVVAVAAGVFMVIMGFNMLNLFPGLRQLSPRMPRIFARGINARKNSNSPFVVGLLNGLMPCGPLQAMQLYALSTGDPVQGALSMFIFSLGTVPLMFGLGALSSLLSKKYTAKMMTASAVLVVVLGMVMVGNGMSLSGIALPALSGGVTAADEVPSENTATVSEGVQTITTTLSADAYPAITVQAGVPVKWIIQADENNLNGCNNQLLIPRFGIEQKLVAGSNLIEFTPTETGTIPYSCWMGMIKSSITVID